METKAEITISGWILCIRELPSLTKRLTNLRVVILEVRGFFVQSFAPFAEVNEGEEHVFCCEVSDEDTEVNWLKNGIKLLTSENCVIGEEGVLRTLTLKNVTPADSGEYACITVDERSKAEGELAVKG